MTDAKNEVPSTENTKMHMPTSTSHSIHSHTGSILAVLIIMLVLILGGLYLWGGVLSTEVPVVTPEPIVNNEPETPRAAADTQILETLSPSDDIGAIEADINSTNFDSLDTDFTAIDSEINAAATQ